MAPPKASTSAGVTALYLLGDHLSARMVVQGHLYSPTDNEIVIYPDCVPGNPLNAKNVVRLLFMWAGYFGPPTDSDFPESEYMYYYIPDYVLNGRNPDNILTIPMLKEDRFPFKHPSKREGSCYLAIKYCDYFGNHVPADLPPDCTRITKSLDISELFSHKKTLITFDNSAINLEAALAGMNVEYRYNETFKDRYQWGRYWTYHDVILSYAKQKELYQTKWLPEFIERTQEHFGGK